MVVEGVIQDGVVVFPNPIGLPNGTPVRVEALQAQPREPSKRAAADDPIWRMAELATDMGVSDLAINADHYLYGHPKVEDEP
jgi:hypothetical protein